jgi:prepilin-type N-terminal cleavage/methylation domain-containing protein
MHKTKSGFTIVELLIVIVVIAILAAISVVAYNGLQDRARATRANNDMATLHKAIKLARISQNRTLLQITGSGCTRCSTNQPTAYYNALTAIANASGTNLDGLRAGDPWGNLYQIDENEGEGGNCYRDTIAISPGRADVPTVYVPTYAC